MLSTLNENLGLTVAEALAAGTPVIATKGGALERAGACRLRLVDRSWRRAACCGLGTCDGAAAGRVEGDERQRPGVDDLRFCWDRIADDMLDVGFLAARTTPSTIRFE